MPGPFLFPCQCAQSEYVDCKFTSQVNSWLFTHCELCDCRVCINATGIEESLLEHVEAKQSSAIGCDTIAQRTIPEQIYAPEVSNISTDSLSEGFQEEDGNEESMEEAESLGGNVKNNQTTHQISEEEVKKAQAIQKYGPFIILSISKRKEIHEFNEKGEIDEEKSVSAQVSEICRPIRVICTQDTPKRNSASRSKFYR
ncbi:MAG: hypothetical protein [Cressdnaviricota sp.]|nr:MAG: hypothetical protein [Cressdnaviricota sp.]